MKSRPRKRLTLDQRRTRILAAATRLFARKGYDGASMSGIAPGAGITKPVLYDHFASKEALFETLLRSIRDDLLAKGRAIGQSSASDELRFRSAVDAFFAFVEATAGRRENPLDRAARQSGHRQTVARRATGSHCRNLTAPEILSSGWAKLAIRSRRRVSQGGAARFGKMVAEPPRPEPRRNRRPCHAGLLDGISGSQRQVRAGSRQVILLRTPSTLASEGSSAPRAIARLDHHALSSLGLEHEIRSLCNGNGSEPPLPWERVGVRAKVYRWSVTPHPICCANRPLSSGEVYGTSGSTNSTKSHRAFNILRLTQGRSNRCGRCAPGLPSPGKQRCRVATVCRAREPACVRRVQVSWGRPATD